MVSVHFWATLKDKKLTISKAECELAGVKKEIKAETASFDLQDKNLKAKLSLPILLSQFNIERPSLLGFAIDDKVVINASGDWSVQAAEELKSKVK